MMPAAKHFDPVLGLDVLEVAAQDVRRVLLDGVELVEDRPVVPAQGLGDLLVDRAGVLQIRVAVRPGDWIALPTGLAHAHQMVNVSAT